MYWYDFHIHTIEGSFCGHIDAAGQVRHYKKLGADGICITDHFYNGNTSVPQSLPWAEWVEKFTDAYRAAKAEGDRVGLDVFFGWEYSFKGTDFLTFGLDDKWLLDNRRCLDMSVSEYCDFIRSEGGAVVQAHPFREAGYIEMIRLLPRNVDAVETLNACRTDFENDMADRYADAYGLAKICASDNHYGVLPRIALMGFEERIKNSADVANAVKSGRGVFKVIENTVE